MQGDKRPLYAQRLSRDLANVITYDFASSSAIVRFFQSEDGLLTSGIRVSVCIFEGPYRGGHFIFVLTIPENYPFRCVEIWSTSPIWHPNIDLKTGRVALPLEWSPVLTLISIGFAIQMIMLEPSAIIPLNLEACSFYSQDPSLFDKFAQSTLLGTNGENVIRLSITNTTCCKNCEKRASNCSSLNQQCIASTLPTDCDALVNIFSSDMVISEEPSNNLLYEKLDSNRQRRTRTFAFETPSSNPCVADIGCDQDSEILPFDCAYSAGYMDPDDKEVSVRSLKKLRVGETFPNI